jgi:hypothetical protein
MEASKMNFDDIARRNDAWGKAYKSVTSDDVANRKRAFGKSQGILSATEGMFDQKGQLPSQARRSAFSDLVARAQQGYQQGVGPLREYVGRQLPSAPAVRGGVHNDLYVIPRDSSGREIVQSLPIIDDLYRIKRDADGNEIPVEKKYTLESQGAAAAQAPLADRSQLQWGNIQRDVRQQYGDSRGALSPEVVRATQQRLAAEQLGGVPLSQAAAVYQGRRDARGILARAAQPKSPAETDAVGGYSPLRGDAANFRKLAELESGQLDAKEQEYIDWKGRRDQRFSETVRESPYYNTIRFALADASMGVEPTEKDLKRETKVLTDKYNLYSRGARANGEVRMGFDEFVKNYYDIGTGGRSHIDEQIQGAMSEANDKRVAVAEDREQRGRAIRANNMFRGQGILPDDPVLAGRIREGAQMQSDAMLSASAMQGNPFAARMQIASGENAAKMRIADGENAARLKITEGENAARLKIAEQQADAQRFGARMGFRGDRLNARARLAEADTARQESQRQFDARVAEVGADRAIEEKRLELEQKKFDRDGLADTGALARLDTLSQIQQYNPVNIGRMAEQQAMAELKAMNPGASYAELVEAGRIAREKAIADATPVWDKIMSDPALAEYAPRGGALPDGSAAPPASSAPVVPGAGYQRDKVADNTTLGTVTRQLYDFYGRLPTVEEVREQMRVSGINMRIPDGWVPRDPYDVSGIGSGAADSNYMF